MVVRGDNYTNNITNSDITYKTYDYYEGKLIVNNGVYTRYGVRGDQVYSKHIPGLLYNYFSFDSKTPVKLVIFSNGYILTESSDYIIYTYKGLNNRTHLYLTNVLYNTNKKDELVCKRKFIIDRIN